MYVNLLSIEGTYRGVSRELKMPNLPLLSRKWREYSVVFDKYLDWLSIEDNSYCDEGYQLLVSLKDENVKHNMSCEIIFYSDRPEEFHLGEGFLGFDVCHMEEGISGLEEGCRIADEYIQKKLNKNGLFASFEDAQEFCAIWKEFINIHDPNTWTIEKMPKPFCVWCSTES